MSDAFNSPTEGFSIMRTRLCLLLAAGLIIPGSAYAASMSETECTALFSRADTNKDGSISGPELTPFQTAMMGTGSDTTTGSTTGTTTGTTGTTTGTTGSTSGTVGSSSSGSAAMNSPMTREQFLTECTTKDFSSVTIQ
jgi:hypothetical protein